MQGFNIYATNGTVTSYRPGEPSQIQEVFNGSVISHPLWAGGAAGAITGTGFGQATSQAFGNATAEGQASVSATTSLTLHGGYKFLSFNLQHGHAKLFCYLVVGCG